MARAPARLGRLGRRAACPPPAGMAGLGACALRSDPELLLKSRRVVPGRLRDAGFSFDLPDLGQGPPSDLVARRGDG